MEYFRQKYLFQLSNYNFLRNALRAFLWYWEKLGQRWAKPTRQRFRPKPILIRPAMWQGQIKNGQALCIIAKRNGKLDNESSALIIVMSVSSFAYASVFMCRCLDGLQMQVVVAVLFPLARSASLAIDDREWCFHLWAWESNRHRQRLGTKTVFCRAAGR